MKLMLDSSYLIGLVLQNDQWHELADDLSYHLEKHDTYITNIILTETMNSFQCLDGKTNKEIYNVLVETNTILNIDKKQIYDNSLNLFCDYDASIGFSDCTTIEMMKNHDIKYVVSYDSDFDKKEGIIRIYNYKKDDDYVSNIDL